MCTLIYLMGHKVASILTICNLWPIFSGPFQTKYFIKRLRPVMLNLQKAHHMMQDSLQNKYTQR